MIDYWFENNRKANYEGFLVILSSDEEYLPSTEQHYSPQELIGKDAPPTQQMQETLEKWYPSCASAQVMTLEEAPDSTDKWSAIRDWIKKRHTCTWSELLDKLDKNGLDSGLLSNFLFEMGKEHEVLLSIIIIDSHYSIDPTPADDEPTAAEPEDINT